MPGREGEGGGDRGRGEGEWEKNRSVVGDVTLNGRGGPKRRREGGGGGGGGGGRLNGFPWCHWLRRYLVGTHEKGYTISGKEEGGRIRNKGRGGTQAPLFLAASNTVVLARLRNNTGERPLETRFFAKWPRNPAMGRRSFRIRFSRKGKELGQIFGGREYEYALARLFLNYFGNFGML